VYIYIYLCIYIYICVYIYIYILRYVAVGWNQRMEYIYIYVAVGWNHPTATYRRIYAPKSMPRNMLRPGIIRSEYLRRNCPGKHAPELPRNPRHIHTGIRVNSGSVYIHTGISTPESGSIPGQLPRHIRVNYTDAISELRRNCPGIWP
jgi:hypothetical protein